MLLSSLGDEMSEVARRRLRYLTARAQLVQRRRRQEGDIRPAWRDPMIAASLWLEAAEIAGALNLLQLARDCIERGARQLLALHLPSGAALDVLMLGRRKSLRQKSSALIERWPYGAQSERPDVGTKDRGTEDRILYEPALVQPQQVAYMALASAQLHGERQGTLMERLSLVRSAPFGRQKMPLSDLLEILSIESHDARAPTGEVRLAAITSIARLLAELHRAIGLAKNNEYLWQRGLSPISVFDLDIAMLIVFLERRLGRKALQDGVISGLQEGERDYAIEFVETALSIA